MKYLYSFLIIFIFNLNLFSHHGVAAIGSFGLEGPGAPLETSTSQNLPKKSLLLYYKMDYADYEKYTPQRDDETDYNNFTMLGMGYGFSSYLSIYGFLPYNIKITEDNSYNTAGFADPSLFFTLSFKYDEGLKFTPENESLDDLMDWHFAIYGGSTIPLGDENIKDSQGNIDPGKSLGFGKPSLSMGFATNKGFGEKFTFIFDINYIKFFENKYENGLKFKFGDEFRINSALNYSLITNKEKKLRVDLILEGTFLNLERDEEFGTGAEATGGKILYILPGIRLYVKNFSLGFGLKFPSWTDLNEENLQQGSEGKENLRLILTFSTLL